MKKYEFVEGDTIVHEGRTLRRIRALRDIITPSSIAHRGDLGGYIANEFNLSHEGSSWVASGSTGHGKVYDEARVFDNAIVEDSAEVFGFARVRDNARIGDTSKVSGHVQVEDSIRVYGNSRFAGLSVLSGDAYFHSSVLGIGVYTVPDYAGLFKNAVILSPNDFISFVNVGSENGTLTAYRSESGVTVARGCFSGSLDQFVEAVQEDHGLTFIGKEYLAMAEVIKLRFNL